ncbi:MAG TPA: phospholipase [Bacteroidetes bacterium]|nr:phospholipase [Bacteroidota bacterium]
MPHESAPIRTAGTPLADASAALILLHGRGAGAADILALGREIAPEGVALLAPDADGATWYPLSFLAPLDANQPHLDGALAAVGRAVAQAEAAGLDRQRIVLGGFSQGACLTLEWTARTGGRWGGVLALSGGLIGTGEDPDGKPPADKRFDYSADLTGTPVFLGCSDVDPHIPLSRVRRSALVFSDLGADVDERIYKGMGHAVNRDELDACRAIVAAAMP